MDTRVTIEESFKELVSQTSYSDVSVSDVCERAHIARKTFYKYFHGKEDIVRSYFVRNTLKPIQFLHDTLAYLKPEELLRTQCMHLYYSLQADRDYYVHLLGDGLGDGSGVLVRSITDAIQDYNAKVLERIRGMRTDDWRAQYTSYFFASSQAMLVKKWIQEGMAIAPEDLGDLYIELTSFFWINAYEQSGNRY